LQWRTSISIAQQVVDHHDSASPTESNYYIGIMSGTSMDAIDAVMVQFHLNNSVSTVAHLSRPFPFDLKSKLIDLIQPDWTGSLQFVAGLNATLGTLYAETALALIEQSNIPKSKVKAIGNHGQTICHQPDAQPHFSWQLGDANRIAELTGITTIADFRNRDIAAGGEGAPLVPAFHHAVFSHPEKTRIILNIGGIANISLLSSHHDTLGFDTGPGNSLMDAWCLKKQGKSYDENGDWAAQGKVIPALLQQLMSEPYFKRIYPKSTGKEYFNLSWLDSFLTDESNPEDVQATLLEVTALSITEGIKLAARTKGVTVSEIYICGGGVKNIALIQRLRKLLKPVTVEKTDVLGVGADWVESIAFAWLARQTLLGLPSNLPSVTGAVSPRVLGATYPG